MSNCNLFFYEYELTILGEKRIVSGIINDHETSPNNADYISGSIYGHLKKQSYSPEQVNTGRLISIKKV